MMSWIVFFFWPHLALCLNTFERLPQPPIQIRLSQLQVIPFSIAIKRMSEILLYKANECTAKLNTASEVVTQVTFVITTDNYDADPMMISTHH